jgi:hypothetical protein
MNNITDDKFEAEEGPEETASFTNFDITVYPADMTLESLVSLFTAKEIIVPPYQRKFIWKMRQASLLIESFLIGLPVPPVFLYMNEENKLEIVDGHQRIQSIAYFFEGYFGSAGADGRRQQFRLIDLAEKSPYLNKTIETLDTETKRKLRYRVLRSINIRQNQPVGNVQSVYYIFERLNTGGTPLRPQEIRNVVARGAIVGELHRLNNNAIWLNFFGRSTPDNTQRDVELVLRMFALFENWDNYEKPMKEFLTQQMKAESQANSERFSRFAQRWPQVLKKVQAALGDRPFRPKSVVNAAYLEAAIVTLLETPSLEVSKFGDQYQKLIQDPKFLSYASGATTDTAAVKERLRLARSYIQG